MSEETINGGDTPLLSQIAESIKRHDSALEALKDIPIMLRKMSEAKAGPDLEAPVKRIWSLGISDDENDDVVNADVNPNDILGGTICYLRLYSTYVIIMTP